MFTTRAPHIQPVLSSTVVMIQPSTYVRAVNLALYAQKHSYELYASGTFANLTIRGISISNLDKVSQDEADFIAERRVEVLIISRPLSSESPKSHQCP